MFQTWENALAVFGQPGFKQADPGFKVVDVILIDDTISSQSIFEEGDGVGLAEISLPLSLEKRKGGFAHVSRRSVSVELSWKHKWKIWVGVDYFALIAHPPICKDQSSKISWRPSSG